MPGPHAGSPCSCPISHCWQAWESASHLYRNISYCSAQSSQNSKHSVKYINSPSGIEVLRESLIHSWCSSSLTDHFSNGYFVPFLKNTLPLCNALTSSEWRVWFQLICTLGGFYSQYIWGLCVLFHSCTALSRDQKKVALLLCSTPIG